MKTKYPLATTTWDQSEFSAINRVIDSNHFTMGREVEKFESGFAQYFKTKYAVMLNSGSSANLLMIASLFYKKENPLISGDEIIVPAVSWSTTFTPLQQYKLKVKFIDIDINTLNYDLEKLAKAITPNTRAILAVNLLGNPNDFNEINKMTSGKSIYLLEDNCEAMGAMFGQEYTGCIGIMGTFSTYFSHHISTMEGGVLVTDDEELFQIALALRAHGWTRNLPSNNLITGAKSDNHFEEAFKFVLPGYNLRPLEISGALGQEQLKKLPSIVVNRRKNAEAFIEIVSKYDWLIYQKEIDRSSWFGFSIIIKPESNKSRDKLISCFTKNGIECRPIVAGNFVKNAVIQYFDYEVFEDLSNANLTDSHGLFIGNHHYNLAHEFELLKTVLDHFSVM